VAGGLGRKTGLRKLFLFLRESLPPVFNGNKYMEDKKTEELSEFGALLEKDNTKILVGL